MRAFGLILVAFLAISQLGLAQSTTDNFKEEEPPELMRWFDIKDPGEYMFLYLGGTSILEHFNSNVMYYDETEFSGFGYYIPAKLYNVSLFTATLEPRIDVFQYNDLISGSIHIPASASFSFVVENQNDNGYFGHATFPIIAQANMFRHSSKADIDQYGVSLGFGIQYIRMGLISLDGGFNPPRPEVKRDWWNPVGRVGVVFSKQFSTQFLFGLNPIQITYDDISSGQPRQKVTYARFYGNLSLFFKL